jgi:hypothetical protein
MVIRKKRLTKIKGNLLKVKHIRTQRGSRMAHVFVRHGKGEVKAVLFPSLYEVMRKVSSRIFKKNAYMEISGHWEWKRTPLDCRAHENKNRRSY